MAGGAAPSAASAPPHLWGDVSGQIPCICIIASVRASSTATAPANALLVRCDRSHCRQPFAATGSKECWPDNIGLTTSTVSMLI